jgi:predicted permease
MIIAGLVLLVATTNLAGVLAARGASRRTEVAVRLALGAGRGRVVRQLLTESTVLALLGGALAIVVAQILVAVFLASTPSGFGRGDVSLRVPLDLRVLGFTALVCLGSGLAVGLLPARRATRRTLLPGLASAHGTEGPSARGGRKYWIVVPQLSASLVLLLVAGALVQALLRAQARDPGFDPEHVAMVAIEAPSGIVRAEDRRQTLVDLERRVLDRAHAVPGVESAAVVDGIAWGLPFSFFSGWVIGRDAFNDRAYRWVTRNDVSSEYFDTLRIPLHAGRLFDERDTPDTVPVAIVSESAARLIWPGRQAVGQYLALHSADNPRPPSWLEVVGVVGDVALPDGDGWNPATYTPRRQGTPGMGGGVLLARGAGPVGDLVRNIREVVESADGTMQVMNARPLVEAVDAALYPRRMAAGMLSSAGLVSLLLAAIGLYGVVSYSVAQRLREMGIRAALGADRLDIIWLILRDGIRILLLGCLAGGALTYGALRTASALVIPLPGFDAVILTAVPAILAIVVIASCAIPAWRASRVDPNVALREL